MVEPISLTAAITVLASSAPHWAPALERTLLNKGKDFAVERGKHFFDERQHEKHVQVALRNAAERGVARFKSGPEREQYRRVLEVLSRDDAASGMLRDEGLQLFTLSDTPDMDALTERYNRAERTRTLSGLTPYEEVDTAPYLSSFFDALLAELYNDPLFQAEMGDIVKVRAAVSGQRSLEDVKILLKQIGDVLADNYETTRFLHDVDTYLKHIEEALRHHKLVGIAFDRDIETAPELAGIFVPLKVATNRYINHGDDEAIEILSALEGAPYLVLLGGPGSGKSITTRYIAWSHAQANLNADASARAGALLPGKPVPLRIELRLLSEARRQRPDLSFLTYAAEVLLAREAVTVDHRMFGELLDRRLMLLMFDGLDEVPTLGERKDLVGEIETFAQSYPGNRIVVTSRPVGYEIAPFSRRTFREGRIRDFDDEQILQFLTGWYRHVLKYESSSLPSDAQDELELFYKALEDNVNLHRLATNPLMLTVMAAVHRFERLPDKRVQVYDKCAELLLSTWAKLKHTDERWKDLKMGVKDQKDCLAQLGFVLHQHAQDQLEEPEATEIKRRRPAEMAVDVPAHFIQREMKRFLTGQGVPLPGTELNREVERFLELVKVEAGLLVERGKDERGEPLYGFLHRTFQEYFAALDLDNRRIEDNDPDVVTKFLRDHLHDPHWREVTVLLLGKLPRKLTTSQLKNVLGGMSNRSAYAAVMQQDLFFVADCLAEDMDVHTDFADSVAAALGRLVRKSSFPSQVQQALDALSALLRTRQYALPAQRVLRELMTQEHGLGVRLRINAAASLCAHMKDLEGGNDRTRASMFLLGLAQRLDLPATEAIAAAQALYSSSLEGSDEERQAREALLELARRTDWPTTDVIAAVRALYVSNLQGMGEQRQAREVLLELARRTDLPTTEAIAAAQALYDISPRDSDERRQAREVLLELARRTDLPVTEVIATTQMLYMRSLQRSDERQEAVEILLELARRTDLPVMEMIAVAQALYDISPRDSDELRQARDALLELARRTDLPVMEMIAVAQALYDISPPDSDELRQARDALLELARRTDLPVTEVIAAAQMLYMRSAADSDEERQAREALVESARRMDLPVMEMIAAAQALCDISPADSDEERQARQILHQFEHDGGSPVEQRLQAASALLKVGTYEDRVQAVRTVLAVMVEELAKQKLAAEWQPTQVENMLNDPGFQVNRNNGVTTFTPRVIGVDVDVDATEISSIAELAQQAALPTEVRDSLYVLLRSLVPRFNRIDREEAALS